MFADAGGPKARLRSMFVDREFFMRSNGQVRFVTISARTQLLAAAAALGLLMLLATALLAMGWARWSAAAERASLAQREAAIARTAAEVGAYRRDVRTMTQELERRQGFLEEVVDSLPVEATTGDAAAPAGAVPKVSAAAPGMAGLRRIEARQLALADRLTRYAEGRAAETARTIRGLGLDPATLVRGSARRGMGGPLQRLAVGGHGAVEPRLARLGASLARMDALERGLAAIPQYRPANVEMLTSSYGVRRDPFTGEAAFHAGLDFRGPLGAPIYAAAAGTVSFVGQKSGYGNVVEIDHGNGLITRYAHMSAFRTRVGAVVAPGAAIGAIGSTGRSTGPHLHFEVRQGDRALNPRPFLEAAARVQHAGPAAR